MDKTWENVTEEIAALEKENQQPKDGELRCDICQCVLEFGKAGMVCNNCYWNPNVNRNDHGNWIKK